MVYHKEIKEIIELLLDKKVSKAFLKEYLMDNFEPERIYNSDDLLISDAYFALLHHACGEENILDEEWNYFLKCLTGEVCHNFEEKNAMLKKLLENKKND